MPSSQPGNCPLLLPQTEMSLDLVASCSGLFFLHYGDDSASNAHTNTADTFHLKTAF